MQSIKIRIKTVCLVLALTAGMAFSVVAKTRTIVVTIDDLPITGRAESLEEAKRVTNKLLAAIRGIPTVGFVNEEKLFVPGEIDERVALLDRWLEQGHELGNHTYSHIAINNTDFEAYKEDLIRGETVTRMLLQKRNQKLRYYRHTQLRTGPTDEYRSKLNSLLKERGYTIAPVTIDNNEYLFAVRYREALALGDGETIEKVVAAYLAYMEKVTEHFEKVSLGLLGYEVPQILLLHANELNADHFPKLKVMLERRGYRFVSLEEALKDPAYSLPEVTSRRGLSWLHRWTLAKGKTMNSEPEEPAWIRQPLSNR